MGVEIGVMEMCRRHPQVQVIDAVASFPIQLSEEVCLQGKCAKYKGFHVFLKNVSAPSQFYQSHFVLGEV